VEVSFDPYREWLGIPDGCPPTDHYGLLGLPKFENDVETIARRADALLASFRRIRPGEHVLPWQRILDQLVIAKACLLDPVAKAQYDAALRGQAGVHLTPSTQSSDIPQPSAHVPLPEFVPVSTRPSPGSMRDNRHHRPTLLPQALRMLGVMVLAAAGVVGLMLAGRHRSQPSGPPPVARIDPLPSPAGVGPPRVTSPLGDPTSVGKPEPKIPEPKKAEPKELEPSKPGVAKPGVKEERPKEREPQEPKPKQTAPKESAPKESAPKESAPKEAKPSLGLQRQEALRRAVASARAAMAKRDLAAARKHVEVATAAAQNLEEEAEAGRMAALLGNLEEFWRGVFKVIAGLGPAQELSAGNMQYIVVAVTPKALTLRTEGRTQSYDLRTLPRPIVEALVQSGFAADASTKVLWGTFLAMDVQGDRRAARRLWEEAARAGEDIGELLKELESEPPAPEKAGPKVSGGRRVPGRSPRKPTSPQGTRR
jgi:hypothetical protein